MSSSDPGVYPEIEAALAARGGRLVDAPVSGAVTGAEAGTLTIMAGGEAGAIDRAAPLFGLMGQRLFRTGALGSGQAMKALNNLASAGAFLLTLEVLLIGQRSGLDPQLMTEILNVSTGRNNSTDKKIIPHVLSRRFDSGFALALMAKDLTTALALAERTGTPTVLGAPTLEAARAALAALGPGADHTALARWLEDRVGEELRPAPRPRVPARPAADHAGRAMPRERSRRRRLFPARNGCKGTRDAPHGSCAGHGRTAALGVARPADGR